MGLSNYIPNSRISQPGVIPDEASRPASPFNGQVIYQQDTDRTLVWNGTAWVDVSTGKTGKPGLVLVKEQTVGTGVSTVDVTDVFSSDYANYRVEINQVDASTAGGNFLLMRFNTSGNNHVGSCYYDAYSGTNTGISRTNGGNSTGICVQDTNDDMFISMDILGPNIASRRTGFNGMYSTSTFSGWCAGVFTATTQLTSFTILPASGTLTGGTIRVYGYN